jgi:hypothetical protein
VSANSGWEKHATVGEYTVWKHAGGFYDVTKGPKPSTSGGYYDLQQLLKMKGLSPPALGV